MRRAPWFGLLFALGACNDGSGGPPPCDLDEECVPICDATCVPDAALSAGCEEFLLACVCECESPPESVPE